MGRYSEVKGTEATPPPGAVGLVDQDRLEIWTVVICQGLEPEPKNQFVSFLNFEIGVGCFLLIQSFLKILVPFPHLLNQDLWWCGCVASQLNRQTDRCMRSGGLGGGYVLPV